MVEGSTACRAGCLQRAPRQGGVDEQRTAALASYRKAECSQLLTVKGGAVEVSADVDRLGHRRLNFAVPLPQLLSPAFVILIFDMQV